MSTKITSICVQMLVGLIVLLVAGPGADLKAQEEKGSDASRVRTTPVTIPKSERERPNPVPAVPEAIEAGRNLFATQCVMCHGPKGQGKGDLAKSLKMEMPDLSDPRLQRKRTDGDLFYIITKGHGQMPGETRLVEQNRWEMVLYIRTLARSESKKK